MNRERMNYIVVAIMILACALTRLAPHPANFTPVTAIALFAAVYFANPAFAFAVPLGAMLLSDSFIGFSLINPIIYLIMFAIAAGGLLLKRNFSLTSLIFTGIGASLFFFAASNFAVWAIWSMYPKTLSGLAECYIAAIPFYRNMIAGDFIYGALLFGTYAFAVRPAISKQFA